MPAEEGEVSAVAAETGDVVLSTEDLRAVTGFAVESAQEVLEIFEAPAGGGRTGELLRGLDRALRARI